MSLLRFKMYMTLLEKRLWVIQYDGPSSLFEKNVSFRVHRLYLIRKNDFFELNVLTFFIH